MNTNINFMLWNARSIRGKIIEFFNFLTHKGIDVCMVTETWLQPNLKLSHPMYKCFRLDRQNHRGGGVAIVIKKHLRFKQLHSVDTRMIENVVIELYLNDTDILKVACVYFPGGRTTGESRSMFKSDLRKLLGIGGNYIFFGDLNCRHRDWGCSRANSWGNILSDLTLSLPFTIRFPNNPTYIPSAARSNPSVLDIILTNVPHFMNYPSVSNSLGSDHLPVLFSVFATTAARLQNIHYDLRNTDWRRYRSTLNSSFLQPINSNTMLCKDDIDLAVHRFTNAVTNAIDSSTPRIVARNNFIKLPNYILNTIARRNYYRRQWNRYRQPSDHILFKQYDKLVKYETWCFRNEIWNRKLSNLDVRSKPFWNISKMLRKRVQSIPVISDSDGPIMTDSNKATAFAKNFLLNHHVSDRIRCPITETEVLNCLTDFNTSQFSMPTQTTPVSVGMLKGQIKRLKSKKSFGLDDIRIDFMKNLSTLAVSRLCDIFNVCLKFQYFPKEWRIAKIVPILKPGKPTNLLSSYRPISLLSNISKLLENVIKEKLWQFIEDNGIIPEEQFGFRPRHSTTHQVMRIKNHVKQQFHLGNSTAMVLLDVEKAFDTVWHDGLIFKLLKLNFPKYLVKIIQSFMNQRSFCVKINQEISERFPIPAGVPQGSVLGPILYILYMYDFPQTIDCQYAFFADDSAVICSGLFAQDIINKIQYSLEDVVEFSNKWKIKVNTEKSQAIFFTRKRKSCFIPGTNILMNGTEITWSNSVRYLGVFLNKRLTFSDHVTHIIKKMNVAIKLLYPIINRKSELNFSNKITILKTVFQSIALYACPVWGTCAKTHIGKIQICQNKILKMMLKLPWHFSTKRLHEISDVDFIRNRIINISQNFENACSFSDNNYILTLFNN